MNNWQKETIRKVWEKAEEIKDVDKNLWRKDMAGALISIKHYANEYSEYGWEIDFIKPVSNAEDEKAYSDISNLQPLQWQNKQAKAQNYPKFSTLMTADIAHNIEKIQHWDFSEEDF